MDFQDALAAAEEAAEFATKTGERRLSAASAIALGAALFANGQRERGLERMRVAIDIRRQIGDEMGFGGDICEYAEAIVAMKSTGGGPRGASAIRGSCAIPRWTKRSSQSGSATFSASF